MNRAAVDTASCDANGRRRRLQSGGVTDVSKGIAAFTQTLNTVLLVNYVEQMAFCEIEYLGDIVENGLVAMAMPIDLAERSCSERTVPGTSQTITFGAVAEAEGEQFVDARVVVTNSELYDTLYPNTGNVGVLKLHPAVVTVTTSASVLVNITFDQHELDFSRWAHARWSRQFECGRYNQDAKLWSNQECESFVGDDGVIICSCRVDGGGQAAIFSVGGFFVSALLVLFYSVNICFCIKLAWRGWMPKRSALLVVAYCLLCVASLSYLDHTFLRDLAEKDRFGEWMQRAPSYGFMGVETGCIGQTIYFQLVLWLYSLSVYDWTYVADAGVDESHEVFTRIRRLILSFNCAATTTLASIASAAWFVEGAHGVLETLLSVLVCVFAVCCGFVFQVLWFKPQFERILHVVVLRGEAENGEVPRKLLLRLKATYTALPIWFVLSACYVLLTLQGYRGISAEAELVSLTAMHLANNLALTLFLFLFRAPAVCCDAFCFALFCLNGIEIERAAITDHKQGDMEMMAKAANEEHAEEDAIYGLVDRRQSVILEDIEMVPKDGDMVKGVYDVIPKMHIKQKAKDNVQSKRDSEPLL